MKCFKCFIAFKLYCKIIEINKITINKTLESPGSEAPSVVKTMNAGLGGFRSVVVGKDTISLVYSNWEVDASLDELKVDKVDILNVF